MKHTTFFFITNETIKIYRKNSETGCNRPKDVLSFHSAYFKVFGLFHPVSEFSLYIFIVSFVTKQKWVYKKKGCMFHHFIPFHSVS